MAITAQNAKTVPPVVVNGVVHFECACTNAQEVGSFYSKIFGWTVEQKAPGYSILRTPDGSINGGLVSSEKTYLSFAVVVPDLDKSLAAVVAEGGRILTPKTDNGWVVKAQIVDPAGNPITLLEDRKTA